MVNRLQPRRNVGFREFRAPVPPAAFAQPPLHQSDHQFLQDAYGTPFIPYLPMVFIPKMGHVVLVFRMVSLLGLVLYLRLRLLLQIIQIFSTPQFLIVKITLCPRHQNRFLLLLRIILPIRSIIMSLRSIILPACH